MYRLRFLVLVAVACLVAAQDTPVDTTMEPADNTTTTTDNPGSTSDINSLVDNVGAGVQLDTTTASADSSNVTSTDMASTTDAASGNSTTPSPSSAATLGVSAVCLALATVAVLS